MRKILQFVVIIASLYDYFRIDIIRYTMHSGLPALVLELIWGWR